MEIKPKFDAGTIRINVTPVKMEKLETRLVADPSGSIPNGIYKVIRWEKIRQLTTLGISLSILLGMVIWMAVRGVTTHAHWFSYVLPSAVALLATWKMFNTLTERSYLNHSLIKYKEDLRIGLSSQPPFITKMYGSFHIKQVKHNWLTFMFLFYVGIFTLLLWWLKDVHWWIFRFDDWIKDMFHNPRLMAILFTTSLVFVSVLHVVLAIQRKRRILEIDAYFGQSAISATEIETLKATRNKAYRRLFIISVMIVLLIPILIRFTLKVLRRKK